MVNIMSFNFNTMHLVKLAKLKAHSSPSGLIGSYKVDTGSDGSIMPYHLFKILFPMALKEQLVAIKNRSIMLNTRPQFPN